jgi:hypothetical protein
LCSLHFADANEVEIDINTRLFHEIEKNLNPRSPVVVEEVIRVLTHVLVEARKLERLEERGPIPEIYHARFTLKDLLIHIPLQYWPLPRGTNCPCAFCETDVAPEDVEAHLAENHQWIAQENSFYSPVVLQVAGLMGIHLQVRKRKLWKCPFNDCPDGFDSFLSVVNHINSIHAGYRQQLFQSMGGFWAGVLDCFKRTGGWPEIACMIEGRSRESTTTWRSLGRDEAIQRWQFGAYRRATEEYRRVQIMEDSPLEALLQELRGWGSSRNSTEDSELEESETREPPGWIFQEQGSESESDRSYGYVATTPQEPREASQTRRELNNMVRRVEAEMGRIAISEQAPDPDVIGDQEEDTEHERERFDYIAEFDDTYRENRGTSRVVNDRMNALVTVLGDRGRSEEWKARELEEILRIFEEQELPEEMKTEEGLDDPIVLLLVQARSFRMCRREWKCPLDNCRNQRFRAVMSMAHHLQMDHHFTKAETNDMLNCLIKLMMPVTVRPVLRNMKGERVNIEWNSIMCHHSGCHFVKREHKDQVTHIKNKHLTVIPDIETLGWYWGTISALLRNNPRITIREVLGYGEVWRCQEEGCGSFFTDETAVRQHSAKVHGSKSGENREPAIACYDLQWEVVERGEEASDNTEEIQDGGQMESGITTTQEGEQRTQRGTAPRDLGLRNIPELHNQELEQENEDRREERMRMIRQREFLRLKTDQGVNIPQLDTAQMRRVTQGLSTLFANEINKLLEKFQPHPEIEGSWEAFEGAYAHALHLIREHIMEKIQRDKERIYGERKINVNLQAARAREAETKFGVHVARQALSKLKDILIEIVEAHQRLEMGGDTGEEDGVRQLEVERRIAKLTKRVGHVWTLVSEEERTKCFGTTDWKAMWEELQTNVEHQGRVIEWLTGMISSHVSKEIEGMGAKAHALRVQDAYRTSKSVAMKRYVEKKESPKCAIDKEVIEQHFGESWSKGICPFEEAPEGHPFHLEGKIGQEEEEILMSYMLDEKNIEAVIKSRQDLSASGGDGISYRIIKAAKKEGVRFMKLLIAACIRNGKVPESWKEARTVLLFKKGDRAEIENWRPISITNCIYRIFTCLMARSWQVVNSKVHLYSDSQKGFIKKTNGCTEHGIMLNELMYQARRRKESLIATAIDFTNAFGSVPHDLIMSVMKQRNFPQWTQSIIQDMYTGATSVVEAGGGRSEALSWRRGVKQGCPLSPLLFNLCLEPLLQAVESIHGREGAFVGPATAERIGFAVQAYADDVVFIGKRRTGIENMLKVLENFVDWAQMEVNCKKCATASYMMGANQRRYSLGENLQFKGRDIPNLTLAESLKYLGTNISARRTVKLQAIEMKLSEMKIRLRKIMESPLLTVQKIDALKTFVLPMLDFSMLNGDVGVTQLTKMDQHIRATVNEALRIKTLPVECHHASWRDGGLSYPSLVDRRNVLLIRSFAQMTCSKDCKIRDGSRWLTEEERRIRHIAVDEDSMFMNWKDGPERNGTACLAIRTRQACKDMNVGLKTLENGIAIKANGLVYETTSADGIGRFLTQKVLRPAKFERLIGHPVHGASFTTLKGNAVSNEALTDIYTSKSDAFFRFLVVGRADKLPTPVNLHRWFRGEHAQELTHCMRCGQDKKPTFAHLLNDCTKNLGLMIQRHNRLATVIRTAVANFVGNRLTSDIRENTTFELEGLSTDTRDLRPDMIFERSTNKGPLIEILEFSCPYGYISHERDTLKAKFEQKWQKYENLANEVRRMSGKHVRLSPIIVSSMGAIYGPSLTSLKRIFGCSDRELRKVARQMSDTVIVGSMEIWRASVKGQNPVTVGDEEERREVEEEGHRLEERENATVAPGVGDQRPRVQEDQMLSEDESESDEAAQAAVELMEDIVGELEEDEEFPEPTGGIVVTEPGSDEGDGQEETDGR